MSCAVIGRHIPSSASPIISPRRVNAPSLVHGDGQRRVFVLPFRPQWRVYGRGHGDFVKFIHALAVGNAISLVIERGEYPVRELRLRCSSTRRGHPPRFHVFHLNGLFPVWLTSCLYIGR